MKHSIKTLKEAQELKKIFKKEKTGKKNHIFLGGRANALGG